MLVMNNVEVMYQNVIQVLRGVSLEVGDGKVVSLLGANGAGKSTTLKAISGLLKTEEGAVTAGNIQFDGRRIDKLPPEKIAAGGIIQVIEGRRVLEHLTTEENLMVGAYLRSNQREVKKSLEMVYHYFPRLKELKRRTGGFLSGGEQQMLVIGRAVMANPKFLLLDEPSMGLSPILVEEIFNIVQRINKEEGTGILLVEQNAGMALGIAEYGYIMEGGRIVLDGPSDKLSKNQDVQEFYFGLSELGQRKSYREVKHYKRRKRWLS